MTQEQQDKLRRALYNAKFTTDAEDENPFVGGYFDALLDIIQDFGQQHHHWMPVEERLPKVGEEVLIVAPSEDKPMKGWLQRNHIWWSKDYACHFENITHWMPLSQAPRKEDNNNE